VRAFALVLTGCLGLALATPSRAASGPAEVNRLIAVLQQTDASLHDKARACQQLGEIGTREAVSALAALLNDEALAAYARSGLEGIPDPEAAAVLRSALTTLTGNRLIGVVNSLGVIRDANAVRALSKLAGDPASGAAKEALLALGRISNSEAIRIVQLALSAGPEALRPDAAAACLIAAEFQLAGGNSRTAVTLYDNVRAANVPLSYRLGATRGAILARNSAGTDLLVNLLRSDDRDMRNTALLAVREISNYKVAAVLIDELQQAKPELQAQLIEAMADCHNAQSIRAVRAKAASEIPLVRQAAFRTLGKIGDRSDADTLLKALGPGTTPPDWSAASASLARLEGPEIDAMILKALASATDADVRVALIDLLDVRSPAAATAELLRQAADQNQKISLAALRAMRSTVGREQVPALIGLTRTYKDGPQRTAAETALYYACSRTADIEPAGEMVVTELRHAATASDKASWIRTLASMGYGKALPTIVSSLRDPDASLVGITIDSLSKWPGPAPIDDLLAFVGGTPNPATRSRALSGAVQLAAAAGNARQVPDATVAAWFQRAGTSAQSIEEKRIVVSGLGRWTTAESVRLLAPYLDDADLRNDAAFALVTAAAPVAQGPEYAMLKPLLDRISRMGSQPLIDRIKVLERSMAAAEAALKQKGQSK
jgi:HEAT repeat protein